MTHYPQSILTLIKHVARLPGIGEKTAERLAMHMLRAPRREVEQLAAAMLEMKTSVRLCSRCFGLSDSECCQICASAQRIDGVLCVVEQPADMVAIEKSGAFKGRYHILQGTLSPMDGIGPDNLRIRELGQRIQQEQVTEIILATGTSVEGEATADYLAKRFKALDICISRIASGVPMGGDLKYVDQVTLKRAIDTRHRF